MNKPKLTLDADKLRVETEVRSITQQLTILSNHVNTIGYATAWQLVQELPGTDPQMTSKLETAVQLIKEASNIFASAYEEYEANNCQSPDVTLDDGDLVTGY